MKKNNIQSLLLISARLGELVGQGQGESYKDITTDGKKLIKECKNIYNDFYNNSGYDHITEYLHNEVS